MKIYTKAGDTGNTQVYLSDIKRVSKDDIILTCYGDLDELNSHIGLLAAMFSNASIKPNADFLSVEFLQSIQQDLFKIGFAISDKPQLDEYRVALLENKIDNLQASLPPQTQFILPGGSSLASQAHICRAVARRAERSLVSLSKQADVPSVCLQYINRLSDLLFASARWCNAELNTSDHCV